MSTSHKKIQNLSDAAIEARIVPALRKRGGRVTVGDVVVDTGLPAEEAENHLKRLLNVYTSHLEVDERGDILYSFGPSLRRRGSGDTLGRALRQLGKAAWKVFVFLFKIAIMATLVIYFVLFVVLIIAAFVAMASRGGDSSSSSSRRGGGLPFIWISRVFYSPAPSYSHYGGSSGGHLSRAPEEKKEPVYKRIFAYVFGPEANDDSEEDIFGDEKGILELIRSKKGLITAPELVAHTGWTPTRAEEEVARLMAAYDGDVRVTTSGTLLYTFPKVALTAGGPRTAAPPPSWDRYEKRKALTGNKTGTNLLITFLNGFNLIAALIAPAFIMPQLELSGPLWYFVLSVFPFLFSLVFFAVPLLRLPFVWLENSKRLVRNTWRFALAEVFRRTERREDVYAMDVARSIERNYPEDAAGKGSLEEGKKAVDVVVREFEPEIDTAASGELRYKFVKLHQELDEGARARAGIDPSQLRLGKIVFSSADDDLGLDQLDAFDEALEGAPKQLNAQQLEQLDKDGAMAAFDAALGAGEAVSAHAQSSLDDFERRLAEGAEAEEPAEQGAGGRRRK